MSRLIGSPPGYVGYEDEDVLVTPLRRRPSSVVLLEDFDRAHPRIQERMLRLLREGEIADTRGHSADVRNSIFILTIHQVPRSSARIGFGDSGADALEGADPGLVRKMNAQVDAVVEFRALAGDGDSPALDLLSRRVTEFLEGMQNEFKMVVLIDDSLIEALERRVVSARDASQVESAVDDLLREPVTSAMLTGDCSPQLPPVLSWDGHVVRIQHAPLTDTSLSDPLEEE